MVLTLKIQLFSFLHFEMAQSDFDKKLMLLFDDQDNDYDPVVPMKQQNGSTASIQIDQSDDDEPGCFSFKSRRKKAESNPFLADFFKRFHQRENKKTKRFDFFRSKDRK